MIKLAVEKICCILATFLLNKGDLIYVFVSLGYQERGHQAIPATNTCLQINTFHKKYSNKAINHVIEYSIKILEI